MDDVSQTDPVEDYDRNVQDAYRALDDSHEEFGVLQGQVHATLALAAATRAHTLAMIELAKRI